VQLRVVRIALAVVAQAFGGVVGVVLVALNAFAVALAEESPEQAVIQQRLAWIAAAPALGLGQALDDQVVTGNRIGNACLAKPRRLQGSNEFQMISYRT